MPELKFVFQQTGADPIAREITEAQSMLSHLVYIRANLPKLLAKALRAGHEKVVIKAILDWGEGLRPLQAIWEELRSLTENNPGREVKSG